jgi:hypothetical protein
MADIIDKSALNREYACGLNHESSIIDDMEEMANRVAYSEYLFDRRNPLIDYAVWKSMQINTNPATMGDEL